MPEIANKNGLGGWLQIVAFGRNPVQTAKRLIILLVVAIILFFVLKFIFLPVKITGPSMQPTYRDGQINFINRLAYRSHEPRRGDIIGIRFSGTSTMYFKRIVGLPGETVAFVHGKLKIDGQTLEEPYVKFANGAWDSKPKQMAMDEYYVVGDNRGMPIEDHVQGAATRNRIVGKVLFGDGSEPGASHN